MDRIEEGDTIELIIDCNFCDKEEGTTAMVVGVDTSDDTIEVADGWWAPVKSVKLIKQT